MARVIAPTSAPATADASRPHSGHGRLSTQVQSLVSGTTVGSSCMVGHDTTVEHRTFVALGDSFTEGLEDDLGPDGRHLGWADRVAAALATHEGGLRYANLAVRGKVLDEVVE